ncbi:glycosyltransferase family 4 protein [Moorena sp. SIO3A5]|uniref:Glycosyltransferase n=2 Tax=Coleofasciculaceae TaxID=1892251 RepID=F4XY55_9CYAN|nr:glycosyltransferase family 4 protein [Moorena sp. SIO3A5]EGJ30452.1 glycosyltransferase [Moorena producens 3L]OLT68651.1 glycosyltransferase WbuB [Moorena producens 3L]
MWLGRWPDGHLPILRALSPRASSSRFPIPYSLLPTPYSLLPIPDFRFPIPYSLLPTPCSLLPKTKVLQPIEKTISGAMILLKQLKTSNPIKDWLPTNTVSDQSLRLSVLTQFFPPDYAATGQLIQELVMQLGKQGMDIKVFTGQPGYAFETATAPMYEKLGKVQIKRSRSAQLWPQRIRGKAVNGLIFAVRAFLHLVKNCRRRNLVLLTTAPPFFPVVAYLARRIFGMRYVCLIYDFYPDIAVELGVIGHDHPLARFWRGLNRRVWRKAEAIIVLSSAMKQRVIDTCPKLANKVAVIHSWANPDVIVPLPKPDNWFAQKHNLVNKFTVLYSGNMGRCHDIDTILETAKLLKDEPIQFVCIGSGAKREALIEDVKRLGLTNFLFLPYQDKDMLPYSLTACDLSLVSVIPGMETLVAPSKLYSALAAGVPVAVICSPQAYLTELIAKAKCGASFVNGDSQGLADYIRSLAANQELVNSLGQAGREYLLENFTPEVIAKQYDQVLCEALSRE